MWIGKPRGVLAVAAACAPGARTSGRRSAPGPRAATVRAGWYSRARFPPGRAGFRRAPGPARRRSALCDTPRPKCAPTRPEHRADILDRVALHRQAAHDDDAAPVLDFVEHARKVGVQRRMAAMLRADLPQWEAGLAHPQQHVFQRRGMRRARSNAMSSLRCRCHAMPSAPRQALTGSEQWRGTWRISRCGGRVPSVSLQAERCNPCLVLWHARANGGPMLTRTVIASAAKQSPGGCARHLREIASLRSQ